MSDVDQVSEPMPPVWAKFAKLTRSDWEPSRFQMAWADGSTLLAESKGEIGDFFERHPYFERAEAAEPYFLQQATRVWLSHRDPPPEDAPWSHREMPAAPPLPDDFFDLPLPSSVEGRDCDLELWGYLDPGYDIFAVHPDVEALWYVWSDGQGPHPDTWGAKIWLKRT
jgi:hypothetical protein